VLPHFEQRHISRSSSLNFELLAKVWVDERQSHFESIFEKQAALSRRAVGLHGL